MLESQQLEAAIWSISEGRGSDDELALLRADERLSLSMLDRLILDAEADLASVRNLTGEERDQVVADFTDTLDGLRVHRGAAAPAAAGPVGDTGRTTATSTSPSTSEPWEPEEVQLQASWSAGQVVGVGGGRGSPAEGQRRAGDSAGVDRRPVGRMAAARRRAVARRSESRSGRDPDEGRARLAGGDRWRPHVRAASGRERADGWAARRWKVCDSRRAGRVVPSSACWPATGRRQLSRPTCTGCLRSSTLRGQRARQQRCQARSSPSAAATAAATTISVITAAVEAIVAESIERIELPRRTTQREDADSTSTTP